MITVDPHSLMGEAERRALARELFRALDTIRASEGDYEVASKLLLDVYNAGRSREHYKSEGGARC